MSRIGYIQSDLDLKLLILYIMNRVAAPISFNQLLDLAVCDEGVDYFSMTQSVSHLVETQHLSLEGELYSITEKGRHNSYICQDSLPYSVRSRCDASLAVLNAQLRRDAQVRGSVIPRSDGTFTIQLHLDDDAGNLLKLELLTPSQTQAQHLVDQFKNHPEQVYNGIVNALLANFDAQSE